MVIFGFYKWRLYPESKNAFGIGNCKDMFSGLRSQRQDLGHFGLWIQLGWCRTWKQRDFWLTKYVDILSPSYEKQMKMSRYWLGCIAQEGLRDFHLLILPDLLVSLANISLDITRLQSLQCLLTLPLLCLITTTTTAYTYTYTHKFELNTHLSYPRKTRFMNFKYLQRSICIFSFIEMEFLLYTISLLWFHLLLLLPVLPTTPPIGIHSFSVSH